MTLTAERLRELLTYDPEAGEFRRRVSYWRWKAGSVAGPLRDDGYWIIGLDGRDYLGHRLAWLYMTGEWPTPGADHKDRVRSNNCWSNLRLATSKQQHHNKGTWGRSGFKGAYRRPGENRWVARIKVDGKIRQLGRFDTAEDAHAAYSAEARRAFGEFACTGAP